MGDTQSQQQQEAYGIPGFGPGGANGCPTTVLGHSREGSEPSDTNLLSQLVQLLGYRTGHSLLLSDLGALLPPSLRHGVKEKGGLRSWLQKYPMLFQVSGQPGKESVRLLLGAQPDAAAGARDGAETAAALDADADGAAVSGGSGAGAAGAELVAETAEPAKKEEDDENDAAVQLRGLPYRATVADIQKFLGVHVQALKHDGAIQLVLNRDGRPSGFARVQFSTAAAAVAARQDLHMRVMELAPPAMILGAGNAVATPPLAGGSGNASTDRYVEVFLYSERPNKLRFKKAAGAEGDCIEALGEAEPDLEALGITKEEVIQQCREHMNAQAPAKLLLSMLGVALSSNARLYLKKTDQGLKHFLAQFPNEFLVDGPKGREMITYLPAFAGATARARPVPNSEAPTSPAARARPDGIHSTPRGQGLVTPSDWGTPQPFASHWELGAGQPGASSFGGQFPNFDSFMAGGRGGHPDWSQWSAPSADAYWPQAGAGWWPQAFMGGHDDVAPTFDPAATAALFGQYAPGAGPAAEVLSALHASGATAAAGAPRATEALAALQALGGGAVDGAGGGPPPCAVLLRGLPFEAQEQDVLTFFAREGAVEKIADGPTQETIRFIRKANGNPTGQAVVQIISRADANECVEQLSGKFIGSRFIEVFHYTEPDCAAPAPGSLAGSADAVAYANATTGGALRGAQADTTLRTPSPAGDTGGSGANSAAATAASAAAAAATAGGPASHVSLGALGAIGSAGGQGGLASSFGPPGVLSLGGADGGRAWSPMGGQAGGIAGPGLGQGLPSATSDAASSIATANAWDQLNTFLAGSKMS